MRCLCLLHQIGADVLQLIYGLIQEEENRNPPHASQPDVVVYFDLFPLAQSNFKEWLRVKRMELSERNANNYDLFAFA